MLVHVLMQYPSYPISSCLISCRLVYPSASIGARPGVLQAALPEAATRGRGGGAEEAREGDN